MKGMLIAEAAIFLEFQLLWMFLFFLGGHIVSLLALGAGHTNGDPHFGTSCKTIATFNLSQSNPVCQYQGQGLTNPVPVLQKLSCAVFLGLFVDACNNPGAYGPSAFTDRKP